MSVHWAQKKKPGSMSRVPSSDIPLTGVLNRGGHAFSYRPILIFIAGWYQSSVFVDVEVDVDGDVVVDVGLFMNVATLVMSVADRVTPWWFAPPLNLPLTFEPVPDKLGDPLVS
jgi:hypothetical protein